MVHHQNYRKRDRILLFKHHYYNISNYLLEGTLGDHHIPPLAILGPAGGGKTTGVIAAMEHDGAEVITVNPSLFGSALEGGPCKAIMGLFLEVHKIRSGQKGERKAVAILLDDIHLALRRDERTSATMNYGMTVGLIQNLIDNPSRVFGKPTPYIPIAMTLNTLEGLPASLRRPGRMRIMQWSYTRQELARIISHIFPSVGIETASDLVEGYSSEPLSFFADLRKLWDAKSLRIGPASSSEKLRLALTGEWKPPKIREPSGAELFRLAYSVIKARGQEEPK